MVDFTLKDKIAFYSIKVEMAHRLRPVTSQADISKILEETTFKPVGDNFIGTVDLSGIWGSKSVEKKVDVTLKVNDKLKRILVIPTLRK